MLSHSMSPLSSLLSQAYIFPFRNGPTVLSRGYQAKKGNKSKRYSSQKHTSALPPQGRTPPCPRLFFARFLTSTQKNPWLRELTLLLPVPATLRSCKPASSTINAWCKLPQITLRKPATALRSCETSADLKSNERRRYSLVEEEVEYSEIGEKVAMTE